MQILRAKRRSFYANTYILSKDGVHAVVIDPAHAGLVEELKGYGLVCEYALLTHCHFDHADGVVALQKAGAKVLCSEEEHALIGTQANLYTLFGASYTPFTIDATFRDGDELSLCGIQLKALVTPGHTAGSTCYQLEADGKRVLFTGDTLFQGTVGRTDFPSGDSKTLMRSLKRLRDLEGDFILYPGHEDDTSLQAERENNPFMRNV